MDSVCQQKEHQLTAAKADKYALYIEALQDPEADLLFVEQIYQQQNGVLPSSLREDFCGTAAISCEFLRRSESGRAIAVDIDPEPLQWCREHLLPKLTSPQADRLQLVERDVLDGDLPDADVVLAPNTSICLLRTRSDLLRYLSRCQASLAPGGLFIMDLYAGPEAQRTGVDRIKRDGFVCLWEQVAFNAITNEALNRIHFHFPDRSGLVDAFVYDMRMWSPAELVDALEEAGFSDSRVFRRATDFLSGQSITPVKAVAESMSWDAYIVGFK